MKIRIGNIIKHHKKTDMNERSFSQNERKMEKLKMNCINLLIVSESFLQCNFGIIGSYSIEYYKQIIKKYFMTSFYIYRN